MKKIAITLIAACMMMFIGCKSTKIQVVNPETSSKSQQVGQFNNEKYVWENFIFTTNKVERIK